MPPFKPPRKPNPGPDAAAESASTDLDTDLAALRQSLLAAGYSEQAANRAAEQLRSEVEAMARKQAEPKSPDPDESNPSPPND